MTQKIDKNSAFLPQLFLISKVAQFLGNALYLRGAKGAQPIRIRIRCSREEAGDEGI